MAIDRVQLAKILELLGSAHDGEALAAARRAHALIRGAGETWQSLLAPQPAAARRSSRSTQRPARQSAPAAARGREMTSYEMLYAVLQSGRVPAQVKRWWRRLEARVLDGDITEAQLLELRDLFRRYVAPPGVG